MDKFTPHYPQPFTFAEAISLDVAVITEEITRLQNSLRHLKQTQTTLHECVAESPGNVDPEITDALKENEVVIGSQEERILMLRLALSEKGVSISNHYDLHPGLATTEVGGTPSIVAPDEEGNEGNGGIDL